MRGEVSSTVAVVSEFRLSSPLDVGGDCQGLLEPTAPPPIVPNAASDIVSADSTVEEFGLVGQPALRFTIASGAGETQSREAGSRRTRVSAARGRALETQLQHFSTRIQTSSDSPRMPRFAGREGPSPVRINTGTAWGEGWRISVRLRGPTGVIHQD